MDDTKPLETEPYKGVRDFYPNELAQRNALFSKIASVLTLHGYEEYNASPLEHSELYESKGNEEIIREQTFSFEDRGGRRVTLRPEMTPTLARMVAAKRRELIFPLRWFSIGNRFRYERPQRGRLREFYQTDVDLVGLPEGEADFEAIELANEILKAFGASPQDFVIRINSRKLLKAACAAAGYDEETSREYLRLLDRKEKMPLEEYQAKLASFGNTNPMDVIEKAENEEIAYERDRVKAVVEELKTRGISNAVYDPALTRGFDYYTGIVFEFFDTDPKNARSLFGGGRYDALVSMFGGEPIPAVGFAFGDVTLADFLETHGLSVEASSAPSVYIGTPDPSDIPLARTCAQLLREAGIRTVQNLNTKALGDQVKEAVRRGIPYFLAYGKDEEKTNMVRIKDLARSSEESVESNQVVRYLASLLKK